MKTFFFGRAEIDGVVKMNLGPSAKRCLHGTPLPLRKSTRSVEKEIEESASAFCSRHCRVTAVGEIIR
jgi:hypothetical protein